MQSNINTDSKELIYTDYLPVLKIFRMTHDKHQHLTEKEMVTLYAKILDKISFPRVPYHRGIQDKELSENLKLSVNSPLFAWELFPSANTLQIHCTWFKNIFCIPPISS